MKIVGTRASGKPSWLVPGFVLIVAMASLIGSTVTSTGPTVINGDLGLSPGTLVTGFPPGK